MIIYNISEKTPDNDGDECLVWMGDWWRHCVWCEGLNKFLTGDGYPLSKHIDLWFYSPKATAGQANGD